MLAAHTTNSGGRSDDGGNKDSDDAACTAALVVDGAGRGGIARGGDGDASGTGACGEAGTFSSATASCEREQHEQHEQQQSRRRLAIHRLIDEHNLDSFAKVRDFFAAAPYHFRVVDDADKQVYLLKYTQVKTDFAHAASHEARGIILCKRTNAVVCYPFDKFFNVGERHAAAIDWSSAEVQHKYDGSIMKVYWHRGAWHVATNGTTDARNADNGNGRTFYELFSEAAAASGLDVARLDRAHTYMFELLHPEQVIVVRYGAPRLVHIGTRHNATYAESYNYIGVEQAETFAFDTIDACVEAARHLGPAQEGYVVRDAAYRRVKIKGRVYVGLHHTLTGNYLTDEQVAAKLVLDGEQAEVVAYAQSDTRIAAVCEHIAAIEARLDALVARLARTWHAVSDETRGASRKDVALAFRKHRAEYFSYFMSRVQYESKSAATREPVDVYFRRLVLERFAKAKLTRTDARAFLAFVACTEVDAE